jgi:hypothetical protein
MTKNNALQHSYNRVVRHAVARIQREGLGATAPGQDFFWTYRPQLIDAIREVRRRSRRGRHHNVAWVELRGVADDVLADRLLMAGLNISYAYDANDTCRDSALQIGFALGFRDKVAAAKSALWAWTFSPRYPVFGLTITARWFRAE